MEDDYTSNSHYITSTFPFQKVGRVYLLNLVVKELATQVLSSVFIAPLKNSLMQYPMLKNPSLCCLSAFHYPW